jgi:YrbI family 3-deoxy-D-manno-octulosonate 8-phosphate phosphatase
VNPVIAIIPARGGSKRVPGKNLLRVSGEPLLVHSIRHAAQSEVVDEVYVSTDDEAIAAVAQTAGARVIERPASLASDEATSESALKHALEARVNEGGKEPELVVFLQCTSPVRRPRDIDMAAAQLRSTGADSLFSACENKRFIWERRDGMLRPMNYDYNYRKREQDFGSQYQENGSIYIFKPWVLAKENNRLGGKIEVYEMDYWSSFQIDTPDDAELCSWILRKPEYRSSFEWPDKLDLIVFDFDGVMTNNTVTVSQDGSESVTCSRADGLGIDLLRATGVPIIVLSTERNAVVAARAKKLGLSCHHGIGDKSAFLADYIASHQYDAAHVVYVGNDVNDAGCLEQVGIPVVVGDAHPDAARLARITLVNQGGRGAVRELADLVLSTNSLKRKSVQNA